MTEQPMTRPGVRVAWPFRVWLGVEVLFGAAAVLAVGISPADTAENFAWPIQPVAMAALFGAIYYSVAPTFVVAMLARRWEMVRVLVVPAAIFTTTELLATVLHWDKVLGGHGAVQPLAGQLPATTADLRRRLSLAPAACRRPDVRQPAALPAADRAARVRGPPQPRVGRWLRLPPVLISSFPWALTPLTTRVLCGFLLAIGTILLSVARENDRDRVRVTSPLMVLLLPAVLFQLSRFWDEVDTSNARFWTTLVYVGAVFVLGVYLARGDWRETLG